MTSSSSDDNNALAQFLESDLLSNCSEDEETNDDDESVRPSKRLRLDDDDDVINIKGDARKEVKGKGVVKVDSVDLFHSIDSKVPKLIESGNFSKFPPELFHHVLKFLSPEDLVACSLVCSYLNYAASNECLWSRLYSMRWGKESRANRLRDCAWKKLYIQRDEKDMVNFVKNTPSEFKEYYIQMQAAKRSHAPILSQALDDHIILDRTLADEVSIWKHSRGLTDELFRDHNCFGGTCSYARFESSYVCEKTGRVHVCDDTCEEVELDIISGRFVCKITGRCFDTYLDPVDMEADQQGAMADDVDPSFLRAQTFQLGYECDNEEELNQVMRFC